MKKKPAGTASKALSREARDLWLKLRADFEIEDAHGLHLLLTACQAYDRMNEAAALVAKHGVLIADRFGQLQQNPACRIEHSARASMLVALKALRLDIEPINAIGRPPREQ